MAKLTRLMLVLSMASLKQSSAIKLPSGNTNPQGNSKSVLHPRLKRPVQNWCERLCAISGTNHNQFTVACQKT
jgi:hypothetical protein